MLSLSRGWATKLIGRQISCKYGANLSSSFVTRFLATERPSPTTSNASASDSTSNPELKGIAPSEISRLRRSILYVPGNDQRKIAKIKSIASTIDSIVLDCEDGVAINKKEEARHTILAALQQIPDLSVRVNSIDSGLAEEDLRMLLSGPVLPQTILLPKVESKTDIDRFLEAFQNALQTRKIFEPVDDGPDKEKKKKKRDPIADIDPIDLIIYTESARGLLDLKEICMHSIEMSEFTKCRLAGIVFGSDDFYASIGATRSDDAREVLLARQTVVLVAKAFDLQAIDVVDINFRDLAGLEIRSREGAAMGFTGKQTIHPAQVDVVQRAFSPADDRIEWANALVTEFEQAQRDGKGAFVFRGQMIDMPLLRQAYNIIHVARKIGKVA